MFSSQSDMRMYNRILEQLERKQKLIVITFFALFFIIAICIVKDYGLSWDEGSQWKGNGEVVFNYIFHDGKAALLEGNEKYHGPVFELILIFIEKGLNLIDTRDVYLMRHVVTFLTFFISVIFFYFLCKKCFQNWKMALLGCILLVLSPRIFADSFYNSKDVVLLSFFIIGMYALLVFHEKQTYKHAILYALICALAIDTRILGIILPLISFGFVGTELIYAVISKNKPRIHIKSFIVFIVLLVAFTILFWPVLWEGPIHHFLEAFAEMSKYHWDGHVLYRREYLLTTELPWHYLPVWIGITTPIAYSLLFFLGLFFIMKQFLNRPLALILNKKQYPLILICFFLPILMVIILKSVVYDGWRHVFFVYPAFILIAMHGFVWIASHLKKAQGVLFLLTIVLIGFNMFTMIRLHPHEYVYFNFLAGKDMKDIKDKYELDYYGVSSKQALDYILKSDTSSIINITGSSDPQRLNLELLPMEERGRFKYVNIEYADYFIGQYRNHKQDYNLENQVFSVMAGNASIMSVFKLTAAEKRKVATKGTVLMNYSTDFENQPQDWGRKQLYEPTTGAHSGKLVTKVDRENNFSDGMVIKHLDSIFNKKNHCCPTNIM